MKNIYIKTTWVDNKTPVNAANLNKIENAIVDLYQNALSVSDFTEGKGIKLEVTQDKKFKVSATEDVMTSSSTCGLEIVTSLPSDYCEGTVYMVINPETGKLKNIYFNGVSIYEVE